MRYLPVTLAAIFIITLVSCDSVEDFFAPVDLSSMRKWLNPRIST